MEEEEDRGWARNRWRTRDDEEGGEEYEEEDDDEDEEGSRRYEYDEADPLALAATASLMEELERLASDPVRARGGSGGCSPPRQH